jgi:hypothetical protein
MDSSEPGEEIPRRRRDGQIIDLQVRKQPLLRAAILQTGRNRARIRYLYPIILEELANATAKPDR